jgi:hypothetical protein
MVLNDIEPCTVFYVHTHGDIGVFTSDSDELSGIVEYISPQDVLPVRQNAVGTGFPPFNTGLPPVNLVLMDACLTGTDNSFSVFLWPYYNAYDTNWCENQAVVGWNELIQVARQGRVFLGCIVSRADCTPSERPNGSAKLLPWQSSGGTP